MGKGVHGHGATFQCDEVVLCQSMLAARDQKLAKYAPIIQLLLLDDLASVVQVHFCAVWDDPIGCDGASKRGRLTSGQVLWAPQPVSCLTAPLCNPLPFFTFSFSRSRVVQGSRAVRTRHRAMPPSPSTSAVCYCFLASCCAPLQYLLVAHSPRPFHISPRVAHEREGRAVARQRQRAAAHKCIT